MEWRGHKEDGKGLPASHKRATTGTFQLALPLGIVVEENKLTPTELPPGQVQPPAQRDKTARGSAPMSDSSPVLSHPSSPRVMVEETLNQGAHHHQITLNTVDYNQPQQSLEGN